MTDPLPDRQTGRLENLAPEAPVEAKIALLLGLAGGLFLAIILSYADPDRQYVGLGAGIALGIVGAIVLTIRSKRAKHRRD